MALALSAGGSSARAVLAALLLAPRARGYAASAASGAVRRVAVAAEGAAAEDASAAAEAEVSWVPDPVTGHYRPSNWAAAAVDPADLRAAHLTSTYARRA